MHASAGAIIEKEEKEREKERERQHANSRLKSRGNDFSIKKDNLKSSMDFRFSYHTEE